MTDRELMQQALDAFSGLLTFNPTAEEYQMGREVVAALRERLAQPQRQWVGLTDEEIKEIIGPWGDTPIKGYTRKLFDQIEAKLKEKNT
jgi:hypothetical protein